MDTCPTVKHGVRCGGMLKEYKKKGRRNKKGQLKIHIYFRCQKAKCRSYHSLAKITNAILPSIEDESQSSTDINYANQGFEIPSTNDTVLYNSSTGQFLQNCVCLRLPSEISRCIECFTHLHGKDLKENVYNIDNEDIENIDNIQCRFYAFRVLELKSEQLTVAGYPDPFTNASKLDLDFWKPVKSSFTPSDLKIRDSKKLLEDIGGQLCKFIQDDKEALTLNWSETQNNKMPIWKKPLEGIREMCDVCKTTIFNYHWSCLTCGFVVCIDCVQEKQENKCTPQKVIYNQGGAWLTCSTSERHTLDQLNITQILPGDSLDYMSTVMHDMCIKHKIPLKCKCSCRILKMEFPLINYSQFETKIPENVDIQDIFPEDSKCKDTFFPCYEDIVNKHFGGIEYNYKKESLPKLTKMIDTNNYSSPPHRWLCNGLVLNLLDPHMQENYEMFQEQWVRGQPVLVSGVDKGLNKSLWSPKSFSRDYGHKSNLMIDCSTNKVLCNEPMSIFWKGFENDSKRLQDKDGCSIMLKLKDWPPQGDFAELSPDRFKNIMDCLPLKEYTHRDGKFNLVSYLPESALRPDLGPKMYIAYGCAGTKLFGTTNLHLDMSDAVNVMVYVGVTKGSRTYSPEWFKKRAMEIINENECDEVSKRRVFVNGEIPGAIWHIYHAQDANYIRQVLHEINIEKGVIFKEATDPIQDQSHYLDKNIRDRLYRDYRIKGYTIIQFAGDVVFIPAGSPHQVKNLHNCIKVAEDFVSPENIHQSFCMTKEFRYLSEDHTNHEDKLQLKNVVFHAVKDSISVLMHTETI